MADADDLKKRLETLETRIRKVEADTHPATPSDHDVSSLLRDLWGEHAHVRQYLAQEGGAAGTRGAKVTSSTQARESMDAMEKKLAQAESLRAGK